MISVVIPACNAVTSLPDMLEALVPAAIAGLITEVIVADGGSIDGTQIIADGMGAKLVTSERSRGAQLAAGARASKGDWLMFLNADAVLEPGWQDEALSFIKRATRSGSRVAAAFRFALDDPSPAARRAEFWVRLRSRFLRLPYGDQGLLINRRFYDELGGFQAMPVMEDVDLARRIGAKRIALLKTAALSSSVNLRARGSMLSPLRNLAALALYYCRVPPRVLARICS